MSKRRVRRSAHRRKPFRAVATAALLIPFAMALGAACTLFNPLDEYGPPKAKLNSEAATTSDSGETGDAISSCVKSRWPARPDTDNGSGELGDIIFALETLSIGGSADAGSIATAGYDLDNNCTCPEPPTCVASPPPSGGGGQGQSMCDLDGGIDSNGTLLLEGFIRLANMDVDNERRIAEGKRGLLVRLRHWNGGTDDTRVELSMFVTNGTEKDASTNENAIPRRDGTDKWTLDPSSLVGGGPAGPDQPLIPAFVDTNAYVKDGFLVANVDFPLNFSELTLDLTGSVFTAKIGRRNGDNVYRLDDGRMAGRWPTRRLLTVLDTLRDPYVSDGGLCGDSGLYRDLKKRICGGADIAADPERDGTNAPCDALSITITFTASQANFGSIQGRGPGDHFCGVGYTDDCSR